MNAVQDQSTFKEIYIYIFFWARCPPLLFFLLQKVFFVCLMMMNQNSTGDSTGSSSHQAKQAQSRYLLRTDSRAEPEQEQQSTSDATLSHADPPPPPSSSPSSSSSPCHTLSLNIAVCLCFISCVTVVLCILLPVLLTTGAEVIHHNSYFFSVKRILTSRSLIENPLNSSLWLLSEHVRKTSVLGFPYSSNSTLNQYQSVFVEAGLRLRAAGMDPTARLSSCRFANGDLILTTSTAGEDRIIIRSYRTSTPHWDVTANNAKDVPVPGSYTGFDFSPTNLTRWPIDSNNWQEPLLYTTRTGPHGIQWNLSLAVTLKTSAAPKNILPLFITAPDLRGEATRLILYFPLLSTSFEDPSTQATPLAYCLQLFVVSDFSELLRQNLVGGPNARAFLTDGVHRVVSASHAATFRVVSRAESGGSVWKNCIQNAFASVYPQKFMACLYNVSDHPEYLLLRRALLAVSDNNGTTADHIPFVTGEYSTFDEAKSHRVVHVADADDNEFHVLVTALRTPQQQQQTSLFSLRIFFFIPVQAFMDEIDRARDIALGIVVVIVVVTVVLGYFLLGLVTSHVTELSERMKDPWCMVPREKTSWHGIEITEVVELELVFEYLGDVTTALRGFIGRGTKATPTATHRLLATCGSSSGAASFDSSPDVVGSLCGAAGGKATTFSSDATSSGQQRKNEGDDTGQQPPSASTSTAVGDNNHGVVLLGGGGGCTSGVSPAAALSSWSTPSTAAAPKAHSSSGSSRRRVSFPEHVALAVVDGDSDDGNETAKCDNTNRAAVVAQARHDNTDQSDSSGGSGCGGAGTSDRSSNNSSTPPATSSTSDDSPTSETTAPGTPSKKEDASLLQQTRVAATSPKNAVAAAASVRANNHKPMALMPAQQQQHPAGELSWQPGEVRPFQVFCSCCIEFPAVFAIVNNAAAKLQSSRHSLLRRLGGDPRKLWRDGQHDDDNINDSSYDDSNNISICGDDDDDEQQQQKRQQEISDLVHIISGAAEFVTTSIGGSGANVIEFLGDSVLCAFRVTLSKRRSRMLVRFLNSLIDGSQTLASKLAKLSSSSASASTSPLRRASDNHTANTNTRRRRPIIPAIAAGIDCGTVRVLRVTDGSSDLARSVTIMGRSLIAAMRMCRRATMCEDPTLLLSRERRRLLLSRTQQQQRSRRSAASSSSCSQTGPTCNADETKASSFLSCAAAFGEKHDDNNNDDESAAAVSEEVAPADAAAPSEPPHVIPSSATTADLLDRQLCSRAATCRIFSSAFMADYAGRAEFVVYNVTRQIWERRELLLASAFGADGNNNSSCGGAAPVAAAAEEHCEKQHLVKSNDVVCIMRRAG